MKEYKSLKESLEVYLDGADYLTEEDAPAIQLLRMLAEEIDAGNLRGNISSTFAQTLRAVQKRAGTYEGADPLEDFLSGE